MGGGGGTSKTVAEPWEGQKPYLREVFAESQKMYNNGSLAPAYYSGNTVASQSPYTTQAYSAVSGQATNGDNAYGTMGNGLTTANSVMNNAISGNQGLANLNSFGDSNAGNLGLSGLNGLGNTNAGNRGLNQLAKTTGANVNAGNAGLTTLTELSQADNPYIDELYKRANNQVQASLDSNFNRAGRYGSGAHEAAAADAANDLANQMYSELYNQRANAAAQASNAYNTGIGEGTAAQQAYANAYNTGIGNNISAMQSAATAYNQGINNNLSAMNSAADIYNQALGTQLTGAATGKDLYNQRYDDAQWLSEIGANQENYDQALIDAEIDRYNYDQQRALTALSNYNQLIQGTYGGTTTATGKSGYTGSALGSALGGASVGASIYGDGMDGLLDYFSSGK